MKEQTITFTAEVTQILKEGLDDMMESSDKTYAEDFLRDKLQVDDIHLKSLKIFPTGMIAEEREREGIEDVDDE